MFLLLFSPQPIPDDGIYWQVNLERFHQHFCNQAIVSAVANRMDQVMDQCSARSKVDHSGGCQMWPLVQRQQQWILNSSLFFQTSSEIVRTMLRMSEITTPSGAPYTQPLSSHEVYFNFLFSVFVLLLCLGFCFVLVFLCSPGYPGTSCVALLSLKSEIYLPLPPQCWVQGLHQHSWFSFPSPCWLPDRHRYFSSY